MTDNTLEMAFQRFQEALTNKFPGIVASVHLYDASDGKLYLHWAGSGELLLKSVNQERANYTALSIAAKRTQLMAIQKCENLIATLRSRKAEWEKSDDKFIQTLDTLTNQLLNTDVA